jgi:penicillin-binding protein 1A
MGFRGPAYLELFSVRWNYLRIAGIAASGVVLLLALAIYGLALSYVYVLPSLPSTEGMRNVPLQVPLRVYTRSGALIAQIGEQRRIPVEYDQVPDLVKHAFLAAEDDRFFEHHGIDFIGMVRAIVVDLVSRDKTQGASTITMQAARNMFLTLDKTYRRKLQEMFVTWRMEEEFSKQEIFGLYLNVIFFGQRAYGVSAAAETFFGKPLDQLTVAEAATIAGIPKAPSRFNPIVNPDAATARRSYVLRRMRELKFIGAEEAERANREPMTARTHALPYDVEAPYIAEMARLEVRQRFGPAAESSGYKVFTTIDGRLQEAANRAVRIGLIEYDRRHGYRGPLGHADITPATKEEQLEGIASEYASVGNLTPAIVVSTTPKSARVYVRITGFAQIDWDGLSWARKAGSNESALGPPPKNANDVVSKGDVVYVVADSAGHAQLAQMPQVQSALVSLDPHDGAVAALVGGFDYFTNKYNRAVQARRQPGSGFKPFLYSSALENGFTAASELPDAPVVMDGPDIEQSWRPGEDSHRFDGPMRLRQALALSRNLVSIRLLRELGTQYAIDYVSRFGFDPKTLPDNLTLALGTLQVTPLELVSAYAVFANGGYRVHSYFIDRIENADGTVVWQATPKIACDTCDHEATLKDLPARRPGAAADFLRSADLVRGGPGQLPAEQIAQRVISPQNDYIITDMMADVIKHGTGRRALALGRGDIAGKTGTTNGPKDTWFNGFTPNLVATVWVGFDQERPLGDHEEGSRTALPIWIQYMREALKGIPEKKRPMPDGIVTLRISPATGTLVSAENPDGIAEIFMADHLPAATEAGTVAEKSNEGGQQSGGEPIF